MPATIVYRRNQSATIVSIVAAAVSIVVTVNESLMFPCNLNLQENYSIAR